MPEQPALVQKDVGRKIAEIRLSQGRTQEDLAEALGIALKYYQRIERGLQNLTITTLVRIANTLGVRTVDLFAPPTSREVKRGRPRKAPGPKREGGAARAPAPVPASKAALKPKPKKGGARQERPKRV